MSGVGAVLDANVLLMAGPRDTLLRAAEAGLFLPFWSAEILDESERNLTRILVKRGRADAADKAAHFTATIRAQFPNALVSGTDALITQLTNDPKDRHVLAAAIAAQASVIVTNNLRHFPVTSLAVYGLDAQTPDTFLADLADLHHRQLRAILVAQGAALRESRTLKATLAHLRPELPVFVAAIEQRGG